MNSNPQATIAAMRAALTENQRKSAAATSKTDIHDLAAERRVLMARLAQLLAQNPGA